MDVRCFFGTIFSVLRSDGVIEGGTGVKGKSGHASQTSNSKAEETVK
jgi:O-antigen biosynthesis protein WbqP